MVPQRPTPKENYLLLVLSISFILGMGMALVIYFGWRAGVIAAGFHSALSIVALVVCPPFILSYVMAATPGSDLAFVLVAGTIVFANAFLYAGVAAGGYFLVTVFIGRKA